MNWRIQCALHTSTFTHSGSRDKNTDNQQWQDMVTDSNCGFTATDGTIKRDGTVNTWTQITGDETACMHRFLSTCQPWLFYANKSAATLVYGVLTVAATCGFVLNVTGTDFMQLTDIIRKRCESGNKSLFQVIQSVFNGKVKPPPPLHTHTQKKKIALWKHDLF